jgi:ribosomal protein S18 acetylase RimI-like enzyme
MKPTNLKADPQTGVDLMPLVFRPARAGDLQRAQEVVVRSINDLTERHGFGPMASVRRPDFQLFSLKDDPDGLWVADDDGEIVGFAFSWVCGELWFLSELFVAPSQQGRGVGNELLAHTLGHARKTGVTNKSLITFTFNVVSQGLYIRHGMLPRLPIYFFSGEHRPMVGAGQHGSELDCASIELSPSHLDMLAKLDFSTLGISREKHHRYLLGDATMKGVFFQEDGNCVGYAYISETGHVGPLAVVEKRHMGTAFRAALRLAATCSAGNLSAFLPGGSEALGIALEQGLRITFPMVLASTGDFGDWTRYLPRNPGFM